MTIMVSTAIREFIIPLIIGVIVGTYSSVFLASPILYEFSKGEKKVKYTGGTKKEENKNKEKIK